MAKIKLNDRVLTLTSKFSCAELEEAVTKAPDACMIPGVCEDGTADRFNPTFVVMANSGEECVDDYGVNFVTDNLDGKATVICTLEGDTAEAVRENAYMKLGKAYRNLAKVEAQIDAWKAEERGWKHAFEVALDEN